MLGWLWCDDTWEAELPSARQQSVLPPRRSPRRCTSQSGNSVRSGWRRQTLQRCRKRLIVRAETRWVPLRSFQEGFSDKTEEPVSRKTIPAVNVSEAFIWSSTFPIFKHLRANKATKQPVAPKTMLRIIRARTAWSRAESPGRVSRNYVWRPSSSY